MPNQQPDHTREITPCRYRYGVGANEVRGERFGKQGRGIRQRCGVTPNDESLKPFVWGFNLILRGPS